MILNLEVSDDVARKIKGLSALTGQDATQIVQGLSGRLEQMITSEIMESLGVTAPASSSIEQQAPASNSALVFPEEPKEEHWADDVVEPEDPESFDMAESLSDTDFDSLDVELPEEAQRQKEEDLMGIKDREGNDSNYKDDIMADAQEFAEDDGTDMGTYEEPVGDMGGARVSMTGDMPDDSGDDLDVLPMDLGLKSVTSDDKSAIDFFLSASEGRTGDKTKRNGRNSAQRNFY